MGSISTDSNKRSSERIESELEPEKVKEVQDVWSLGETVLEVDSDAIESSPICDP